jgi:hypothetical protein
MSSKSVFSCSAVSHVSAIFAYIPNKPEVDVQKKKEMITWLNTYLLH